MINNSTVAKESEFGIMEIKEVDRLGNALKVEFLRTFSDLCSNTICNYDDCHFGYDVCEGGWKGSQCDKHENSIGAGRSCRTYLEQRLLLRWLEVYRGFG